jgi:hypothetical protein
MYRAATDLVIETFAIRAGSDAGPGVAEIINRLEVERER